jgi:8-oxo-dGTP diphosphatase
MIASSTFVRIVKQLLAFVRIEVVAAIIRKNGSILITKRPDRVHLAGLWEFPGGKVEPGETLQLALIREIREELGIEICVDSEYCRVDHDYPSRSVRLNFLNCTILGGEPQPLAVAAVKWVSPEDLRHFQFPPADATLISSLIADATNETC